MSDTPATDIHVDRRLNHSREISIYDRYGAVGSISLTVDLGDSQSASPKSTTYEEVVDEAELVRDRLTEVLDDG